jgi:hypothetical protein
VIGERTTPRGIDVTRPNAALVWDYIQGGFGLGCITA